MATTPEVIFEPSVGKGNRDRRTAQNRAREKGRCRLRGEEEKPGRKSDREASEG